MTEAMEIDDRPLKRLRLQEDIENISIGKHLLLYPTDCPLPLFAIAS